MATALDTPSETLDASERRVVDAVRRHGWFRTTVPGDDEGPGFSYTTGFWLSTGTPELILFSLEIDTAHALLWDLYRDAAAGRPLPVGTFTGGVLTDLPVYAFPVAKRHYRTHLGWSPWFYGGDAFPCLQIVWPDAAGRLPWETGFDASFAGDQIDLTEHGWAASLTP